jgi:transcriptional regulator with XRE-family HTH domain
MGKTLKQARGRSPLSGVATDVDLSVRSIRKQEFAKRLYGLLQEQDMNQSDLANKSGLGRDSISQYVRAINVPSPKSLKKIADVFGIEPSELYPNYEAAAVEEELPEQSFRAMSGDKDFMWVRLNIKLPKEKAVKIMGIINSDD